MANYVGGSETKYLKKHHFIVCPECNSDKIIQDYKCAEMICSNCGIVVQDHLIDDGPDWRAFDLTEMATKSRVSPFDRYNTTQIGTEDRDSSGKKIPPEKRAQIYRLRKHQRRERGRLNNKTVIGTRAEIDRIISQLCLPNLIKRTAYYWHSKCMDKEVLKFKSTFAVAATLVYLSCRLNKYPYSIDEIKEISKASKKQISRLYGKIVNRFKLNIKPIKPRDYISRLGTELKLPPQTENRAVEILDEVENNELQIGKSQIAMAAAAIYIAGLEEGEKRTQREVCEIVSITEVTLRSRYKEIVNKLKLHDIYG